MTDNTKLTKEKVKNETYMNVINLSDRLIPACATAIVITVIIACIDIILIFTNLDNLPYMFDYLNELQVWSMIIAKMLINVVLIVIEVVLYKVAGLINKLSSTIFRFDEDK